MIFSLFSFDFSWSFSAAILNQQSNQRYSATHNDDQEQLLEFLGILIHNIICLSLYWLHFSCVQSTCACCKTVFTVPNVPENAVLVRFDVLFAYIFDAVTGGKGMVQLKISTAKNQTIAGSDQHQRMRPLATTPPRRPTLCRPRRQQQRPRVLPSRTSLQLRLRQRPTALPERGNRGLVRAAGRAWFRLNQCAWIVVTACKPVTATASPCNSQSLPQPAGKNKKQT